MPAPQPNTSSAYPPCSYLSLTPASRRALLVCDVDVIIDGGANRGQWATWIRSLGFGGRIVSLEPQTAAYDALARASETDHDWDCHNVALGRADGHLDLHVAADSAATSALQRTESILSTFPANAPRSIERVPMRSLASLWPVLGCKGRIYLKLDVEGSELAALEGAETVLSRISILELEASIATVFRDGPLIHDLLDYLSPRGFALLAIEPNGGDDHATGQQLMCDAVFRRLPRASAPTSTDGHGHVGQL